MRNRSLVLLFGATLLATSPTLASAQAPARQAPVSAAERARVWPQAYSDVKPDPAVRFGQLPNGMRYAILKNATPTGQASFRLRMDVGSIDESDAEQGLAHVLEHMAFKGSTHVKADEFIKILERKGLAFGPDTNASTSWTETVYMLDLPQTDADTVDTGLLLMRDQAGELTLAADALNPERGVVLSEERLRDTPQYRATKAQLGFWLKGQRAADRFPIGKTEVIQNAPTERVQAFYRAHYRPENATFIVVGDVDVDQMEAKLRARFSDWRGIGPAAASRDVGKLLARGPQTLVTVQPGAATSAQIVWAAPYDDSPDSLSKHRRDLVEQLGFAVLNRRLGQIARSPKPPFIAAGSVRQDVFKSARLTLLSVNAPADGWRDALVAADGTRRQTMQFGVGQAELDREILEYRTALQAAVAAAATRRTPTLAAALVKTVNDQEVFTSPAQDLAEFDAVVRGLKAEEVSAALRRAYAGQGPLVSLTTPTAVDQGDATLAAAFAEAEAKPVVALAAVAAKPWPYTNFGAPGRVVERREVADLGTTFVRFANGVRLTVRPSKLRQQQVLAAVRVGHGLLELPRDRASPTWAARVVTEGGLGKLTSEEIDRALADRVAGVSFAVDEDAYQLSGGTRPADLLVEMQLLTAHLTDPAFRPESFERTRSTLRVAFTQLDATPQGVFARKAEELQHGGDLRWRFPDRAALDVAKLEEVRGFYASALASGAIEVIVTGDVTVDAAVAAVAASVGALPARTDRPLPAGARISRFPAPNATPVTLTHTGRADQALGYVAWPAPDLLTDHKRARRVRVLQEVLQLRLLDEVRTRQGLTYSPQSAYDASTVFPGYGYLAATVETPPERLSGFDQTVAKIVADLAATGPSPDELDRAKRPRIEAVTKALETNEYWRSALEGAQVEPRKLEAVRGAISDLQAVTAADVQREAAALLRPDRAWTLRVQAAK